MFRRPFSMSACALILFCTTSFAQSSQHVWSKRFGNDSWAAGSSVAVDASGNVFLAGGFAGAVNFGGGDLVSAGSEDIYLAKFSAGGSHVWSRRFGEPCYSGTQCVASDASGNVYFAGSFGGAINLGGGQLVSAGGYDIFLSKFDPNGAHLWSRRFGDVDDYQEPLGVATDASGNVFITGYFRGTVDFGGGPLASAGGEDIFLAKFGADGSHVWSQRFGDTDWQVARAIAVDGSGNALITGEFYGTVNFGGATLTSAGSDDIFIARFNASGTYLWSRRFGDANWQEAWGIAVDTSGGFCIFGDFDGVLDFGKGPLTSQGGDIFIAKFGLTGIQWSKRFGDADYQHAQAIAVDPSGNVLVTGHFFGTVDFGGSPLTQLGTTYDVYLAKFDTAGNHLWSRRFGDTEWEESRSIAVDSSKNSLITGIFGGTIDFGGGPLSCDGDYDVFLAKLAPPDDATAIATTLAPGGMTVGPNYPNPFNPSTTIPYSVARSGRVDLGIYDALGRSVRTLVHDSVPAGTYYASWDGRDERGTPVASGVYFARLECGGEVATQRMVLLK